jgi:hypothetical protein
MTGNFSRSRRRSSQETAVDRSWTDPNSGGPLMDRSGNVIGVIQSKLNALLMAPQLGAIPENISFALKGSMLTEFLDWVGTEYQTGLTDKNLSVTQIRQQAETFTAMIECIRVEEAPD